jgi:hypothetical protein
MVLVVEVETMRASEARGAGSSPAEDAMAMSVNGRPLGPQPGNGGFNSPHRHCAPIVHWLDRRAFNPEKADRNRLGVLHARVV